MAREYRKKEYFALVRNRKNIKSSPFMLTCLVGSSKEKLEQELSDAGLVPFQNKLMTKQQLMKQGKDFYNKVGIISPEFEVEAAVVIYNLEQEKTPQTYAAVAEMFDRAKNVGYCEQDNIYNRLQNAMKEA